MKTIPEKDWELINLIKCNEGQTSIYDHYINIYHLMDLFKLMMKKGLIDANLNKLPLYFKIKEKYKL